MHLSPQGPERLPNSRTNPAGQLPNTTIVNSDQELSVDRPPQNSKLVYALLGVVSNTLACRAVDISCAAAEAGALFDQLTRINRQEPRHLETKLLGGPHID